MGILGYPNMDDNNRDGSFGDYSDIYSNFSEEGNGTSAENEDAYNSDLFDEQPAVSSNGATMNGQSQQQDSNQGLPPAADSEQRRPQKGSGLIYILILGLLFAGAVGMFFYKKNAEQTAPPEEQAMGDYFYDQAADGSNAGGPATDAQASAPQGDVATVDVELTPGVSKPAVKADAKKDAAGKDAKAQAPEKQMNAIEKAMAKKKADEEKENRVGLGNAVVIPVSAGGRPDPFLPYNHVAQTAKPKFDLVAPPMEIPESDPMLDKVFEFKLTGIMYDDIRPSAILSVDGTEQLVHKGDSVMGYKILNITRKSVTVKYKSNTYEVSAGQSIGSGVNLNPVSSLSKQFGGAYSSSKNVIQFNN